MIRRRLALVSCCLALLVAPAFAAPRPTAAAKAVAADAARALLDSVSVTYGRLARFQFEGQVHAEVTGPNLPQKNEVNVPILYAAVRPSKLRNESRNPNMTTVLVADGDSLWISVPTLHQFTVQAAPLIVPGGGGGDEFAHSLDPLLALASVNEHVHAATLLGTDTVRTTAGAVTCRKLQVEYEPDTTRPSVHLRPRVLWVDEARRIVLRDSVTADLQNPQMGQLLNVVDTRFVLANTTDGGPDSLYVFRRQAGVRRVDRIGAPGMEPPDLAGQPAKDFTLSTLDGKRVTLSKLRGQVVVLDFWATWCGPCRRWLPTVAKLSRELTGRGVRIFAVNLHEPVPQVRSYLAQSKIVVPVLLDADGKIGLDYGAQSIPLTVIVGRDGKIVHSLLGLHPEADLRAALKDAGVAGM